jgi:hypothetical protein
MISETSFLAVLQASLDLQLQFVRALRGQTTEEDFVPISFSVEVGDEEELDEGEGEGEQAEEGGQPQNPQP